MRTLGIREAKAHLSEVVRAAAAGERCLVTDNRKPVAMIAPLPMDAAQPEILPLPVEEAKLLSEAAAFRRALFRAPFPLELDF